MIRWKWFKRFEAQPQKASGDQVVQSWDIASKAEAFNDWSVCTTWLINNDNYYLLQVTRERLEFPHLKKRIVELARYRGADSVLIEDKGAGTSLIQDLRHGSDLAVIAIVPKEDKATRMMAATPLIESGRVSIPEEAPWLAGFQREMVRFPKGKHDDQVDSLSQFLNWARDRCSRINEIFVVPSILSRVENGEFDPGFSDMW